MKKQLFHALVFIERKEDSGKAWISHRDSNIGAEEREEGKPIFDAIDAFMQSDNNSSSIPENVEFCSKDYWEYVISAHEDILGRLQQHLKEHLNPTILKHRRRNDHGVLYNADYYYIVL